MVKGKIEIKRIDDAARRQVTFTKRRNGLFKKAMDLSVLCDVRIGVIIVSSTKRVYDFATNGMKSLLEEYNKIEEEDQVINSTFEAKLWKIEAESLRQQLYDLSKQVGALKGENIDELDLQELENLDRQIQTSITALRARKETIKCTKKTEINSKIYTMKQVYEKTHEKKIHCATKRQRVEGRLSRPINLNVVDDPFQLQLGLS